jgi:general secretion pathway protein I
VSQQTSHNARGFTLIEMLVALSVFSVAALALVRMASFTIGNTARLDSKHAAQIVARNLIVEALTDPEPPPYGTRVGVTRNGGREWQWVRVVSRTADQRLSRVDVRVMSPSGGTVNVLTSVRLSQ